MAPRFSPETLAHALCWEKAYGDPKEDPAVRDRRIIAQLSERITYYAEMEEQLPSGFAKAQGYAAMPFNLKGQSGSSTSQHKRVPDRKIWAPDDEEGDNVQFALDSENRKKEIAKRSLVFDVSGFEGGSNAEPTLRYFDDEALRIFFEQGSPDTHLDKEMHEALAVSRARLIERGKLFHAQRREHGRFLQGTVPVGRKKSPLLPVFPKD